MSKACNNYKKVEAIFTVSVINVVDTVTLFVYIRNDYKTIVTLNDTTCTYSCDLTKILHVFTCFYLNSRKLFLKTAKVTTIQLLWPINYEGVCRRGYIFPHIPNICTE
jgi:hypothetical protein